MNHVKSSKIIFKKYYNFIIKTKIVIIFKFLFFKAY